MQWIHNCGGRLIDYNPLTSELYDEGVAIEVLREIPDQLLGGQDSKQEIDICSRCKCDLTNNRLGLDKYHVEDQPYYDEETCDHSEQLEQKAILYYA